MNQVQEIYERIIDIANGAALMTGTKVVVTFDKACSDIIPNDTLGRVMYEKMKLVGVPEFTDEEKSYASYYINTFSADEKDGNEQLLGALGGSSQEMGRHMMLNRDKPLMDDVMPYFFLNASMPGSSDVGDVSWITPTTQCATTCYAASTPNHSWQLVAQGKSSIAHKGMLYAAKVMALSAVEIYLHPEIAENAKEELKKHLGEKTYISPIPAGIKPKPYQ
jgi:aminobenzoyl-glutamate utilization protein B